MEKSENTFSWSGFYSYRKKIRKMYPSLYNLKIRKKLLDVIIAELKNGAKILDVGAYNNSLGEKIISRFPSITYKTMDIDRTQPHDYYSLDEISETYDMVILSEVIEHIEFREGISVLKRLLELLNNEGKIILSTPNVHHPNRYWVSDHITPYRYDEIGGALLSIGFKLNKIYRIYNDQFLKRVFRLYIASHLHRYLDIDFAKSIVVVAQK
ncbi:MAG TPA: methyltransferase domain-containing protein [Candidatus Humimicrobiaceae bacterium]|nr:methyltransferase domain-containing protein [Candidatus Humimicrobiaceae bacterium]